MSDTFPFMMHKRTFAYVPTTAQAQELYGSEFVGITAEQAKAVDADRQKAGVEILRAVVARDNAKALVEAEEAIAKAASAATAEQPQEATTAAVPSDVPFYVKENGGAAAEAPAEDKEELPEPAMVQQRVGAAEDYASLSLERLRAIAVERGLEGCERMSRKQIAAALAAQD